MSKVELVHLSANIKLEQKQSGKEIRQNVSVVNTNLVSEFVK
jgi:hypothetical protein